jgi:hypothetical protein
MVPKQHMAVDDKVGVILDVKITTGQTNEGEMIEPQCFRYDARHDILKCPREYVLRAARPSNMAASSIRRRRIVPDVRSKVTVFRRDELNKAVVVGNDYPALLRARRRRERWSADDRRLYQRHRWRSEGFHGEAKTWQERPLRFEGNDRASQRALAAHPHE